MPDRIELPRPIAFALSAGASLGAMQVGMLRAAYEAGIRPDLLLGSSAGSLNAAYMAQGWTKSRLDRLDAVWRGLRGRDVFGDVAFGALSMALTQSGTLAKPTRLRALMRAHLPRTHEELAIPMTAVATDLASGRMVSLSSGDLRTNVQASAAIPLVFPAVEVDGRPLVDGAVSSVVPLVPAVRQGAKTIVAFDVSFPCLPPEPPDGAIPELLHVLRLMLQHQPLTVLPLLESTHTVLYVPSPCPLGVGPHDFRHADDLIDMGYEGARSFFRNMRVAGPGVYGHPLFGEEREAVALSGELTLLETLRGLQPLDTRG